MKVALLILLTDLISFRSFSQYLILEDSLKIDFYENDGRTRVVESQEDLNYKIILTNISKEKIYAYASLTLEYEQSKFANYYWELRKKNDSGVNTLITIDHSNCFGFIYDDLWFKYGKEANSIFLVYDLPKKILLPLQTDTLQYNILMDKTFLVPGEYMFRVFFRVNNFYAMDRGKREIVGLNYVCSDGYFFKVEKPLVAHYK